jgi:hypothetical protein
MKNTLIFFSIILLCSCDNPDFSSDTEMKLKEGKQIIYSSKGLHKIIKRDGGVSTLEQKYDANYYYKHDDNTDSQFIIKCLHMDCNEKLDSVNWSTDGNNFSFFVSNSTRYLSNNRLVLFKISNKTARILIDIRDKKIKKYFFKNELFQFIYENSNDTVSIKL